MKNGCYLILPKNQSSINKEICGSMKPKDIQQVQSIAIDIIHVVQNDPKRDMVKHKKKSKL